VSPRNSLTTLLCAW